MVAKVILTMRGVNQKKHNMLHEEGDLMLIPRPMAYKGTAHAWLRNLGSLEQHKNWTEKPRSPDPAAREQEVLSEIRCPECNASQSTKDQKLHSKVGYSQIKCKECQDANIAMKWQHTCGSSWIKCGVHIRRNLMKELSLASLVPVIRHMPSRGGSMSQEHGVDRPMPKKRHFGGEFVKQTLQVEQRGFLFPSSKLARRFPHCVR